MGNGRRVVHTEGREARIANDQCPECGGELDTGWECNDCGFDAKPELKQSPEWKQPREDHE